MSQMKRVGFTSLRDTIFSSKLVVMADAARALLRDWEVKDIFWKKHRRFLQEKGLEVPDWVLVSGVKARRQRPWKTS